MARAQDIANPGFSMDLLGKHLRKQTYNIHAVFLFEAKAKDLLREICRSVGTAVEGKLHSNWKHFAYHLGVPDDIVTNIGNWLLHSGGPVEHVLSTYVQRYDATLEKVIRALEIMERKDVIFKINDDVQKLVGRVHERVALRDAAGIYRLQDRPSVPLILELDRLSEDSLVNDDSDRLSYTTTLNNNKRVVKITSGGKQVALTVMLTCAPDGNKAEKRIAEKLRSLWPKIGVVVLREQQKFITEMNRVFIVDCIKQVDVVMPILTKGYFDAINGRVPNNGILSMFDFNQQYVKYIYDTMSLMYQRDGCINEKIRCILPSGENSEILEINPEINVYFGEDELEEFIQLILETKEEEEELRQQQER